MNFSEGDVFTVPISHGEGRFVADEATARELLAKGQVATVYVDGEGVPTQNARYNPNNSVLAVEGLLSPDGRVFGKMAHNERAGDGLYRNVPGNTNMDMFRGAVEYYR
jgi:phosphoribosylformylglycinamidine synthase